MSAADIDALAAIVMSESAKNVDGETKKIDEPKAGATYALKLSGDYATAPKPLAADAPPAALRQPYEELTAMVELNRRKSRSLLDAAAKSRHDVAMNVIRNLK